MLDKIVFVSDKEVRLIFDDRLPFSLVSDVNVLILLDSFMAPPGEISLAEYTERFNRSTEDTTEILVDEVA